MNIDQLKLYKKRIEIELPILLEKYLWTDVFINKHQDILKEAILYSVFNWKKIRWILAMITYLWGSWKDLDDLDSDDNIFKLILSIECIQSYTLIHDDLPAMDNWYIRHWKPTVWKEFWEMVWILSWDLLIHLWYEILADINVDPLIFKELILRCTQMNWVNWIIWWQTLDVRYWNESIETSLKDISLIAELKTWRFIQYSLIAWYVLSWKFDKDNINILWDIWRNLWIAFQIRDDILDVEWDSKVVWKDINKDKTWFVVILWLDWAKTLLENTIKDIFIMIEKVWIENLINLVKYIQSRDK